MLYQRIYKLNYIIYIDNVFTNIFKSIWSFRFLMINHLHFLYTPANRIESSSDRISRFNIPFINIKKIELKKLKKSTNQIQKASW